MMKLHSLSAPLPTAGACIYVLTLLIREKLQRSSLEVAPTTSATFPPVMLKFDQ